MEPIASDITAPGKIAAARNDLTLVGSLLRWLIICKRAPCPFLALRCRIHTIQ